MSIDRFIYTETPAGCWEWDGYRDRNGYGRIYNTETKVTEWAHRWSYQHHKGDIPTRYEIDHVCQNPPCVNPAHLDAVSKLEHCRRTFQRLGKDDLHAAAAHLRKCGATYAEVAEALDYSGRSAAAAAVKVAIHKGLIGADEIPRLQTLTDTERSEIVDLVAIGVPQAAVAELYGIHNSQVSRISRGITSGHGRAAG